jgi:ABC-2 type transport system ATP-binding protein
MNAIETGKLTKKFGPVTAVDGLDLQIPYGQIFGLLGPNGAGKSTTLNMLCTILRQTSGNASVGGHDILTESDAVRHEIGIVFQDPSIDDKLTGFENMELHAALYGLSPEDTRTRIKELLALVELTDKASMLMRTYSGGMRRRLELARGLLHHPKILFLDEPTIGLDPQTREHIWKYIEELIRKENITVVLTTHYMDEADRLCDRVGIIDAGKIVALDTPANLKQTLGGDVVTAVVSDPQRFIEALCKQDPSLRATPTDGKLRLTMPSGDRFVPDLVRLADSLGMKIDSISVQKPTLNDVFLHYTGHEIREEAGKVLGEMGMRRRRQIK